MSKYSEWIIKRKIRWDIRWLVMKVWLKNKHPKLLSKSAYSNLVSWSNLAIYGNNPVVKLTLLAPLFAQILIHEDAVAYLQDLTKVKWLYFSLMCFSFAQFIYMFICDRDIKGYPSEVKFTQAMEATTSDEDLNRDFFNVYKRYFSGYGGPLKLGNYEFRKIKYNMMPDIMRGNSLSTGIEPDSKHTQTTADNENSVEIEKIFSSVYMGRQYHTINWKHLCCSELSILVNGFQGESQIQYDEVQEKAVEHLMVVARSEMLSSHWRAKAIKRRYDRLNTNDAIARYAAGFLYSLGTIYFIFTGGQNILKAVGQ